MSSVQPQSLNLSHEVLEWIKVLENRMIVDLHFSCASPLIGETHFFFFFLKLLIRHVLRGTKWRSIVI